MVRSWRRAEARLLQEKYGGDFRRWLEVHDRALEWYTDYWAKYGRRSRTNYHDVWVRSEVEWAKRTLSLGGVHIRMSKNELFNLDRELVYKTSREVDAMIPKARRVLARLRRMRCRLFLVSGADSDFINGVLEGSRASRYFDGVFSPDKVNAFKGSPLYWRRILQASGSSPNDSIVVDDQPRMLVTPLRLGMRPVLITRNPSRKSHFSIVTRIEELPRLVHQIRE
jgi:FMN phosphatase YigB (HAD superfamily)